MNGISPDVRPALWPPLGRVFPRQAQQSRWMVRRLAGRRAGPNLLYSGAYKRELRHLTAEGVDLTANGIYSVYIVDDPRAWGSGAVRGDSAAKSAVVSSSASTQQSFEWRGRPRVLPRPRRSRFTPP